MNRVGRRAHLVESRKRYERSRIDLLTEPPLAGALWQHRESCTSCNEIVARGGQKILARSRMQLPPRDHLHRTNEEVLLGVLPGARAAGGALEPLAREHLPVVRQAREQRRVGGGEVAAHQRPQERLEAAARQRRGAAGPGGAAVPPAGGGGQAVGEGLREPR